MQTRSARILEDIRQAAAFILEITEAKSLDEYQADRLLRNAVERNFEIIGEALKRLEKIDPDTAARISNYPRIIAFRNVLIHGYDVVDTERVWQTIKNDLPVLEQEVKALQNEVDEQ